MIERGRKRLFVLSLGVFFLFCMLLVQFYNIQIVEGEKWSKLAERQHFFEVKEPATRGAFFSNTTIKESEPESHQKFVVDIEKYHLFIDPESIPLKRKKEIAEETMNILSLPQDQRNAFRRQFFRKSRSRKCAMWLDFDVRERILKWWTPYAKEHKIPINALYFVSDYQRSYPFGHLLGQVLHTVQNIKDENNDQANPTGGLELCLDKYLKGKFGRRKLMRSPRHAMETGNVCSYPQNGADVYLTINHVLQAIAEEEIEKGIKQYKAKGGWAVMMDPHTGEIFALAQYPFFDPSKYQHYFNDPELIEHTKVKAVTDANEPGSVMKPITAVIAMLANQELKAKGESPLFDPEEKISTASGVFPGRSKPITDTHFHHFLNMDMAIQRSSNIYMARLVERIILRLGPNWYRSKLQEVFGFGLKTNIELPAESSGLLPRLGKTHPNGALEWSLATPFSMAFGHNLLVNTMQSLRAHAVLANGGYLVQPTLIKKIIRNKGDEQEIILDNTKAKTFPRVLPAEIVERIVRSLKFPTKMGGTSRRANISGFTHCGKSGTAKKIVNGYYSETCYVASFMGFAPAVNPKFLLIVTLDEPEYGYVPGLGKIHNGGNSSASIFREIASRSLKYLGVVPDDPYGYPVGDPRYNKEKAAWAVEARQLQEIYEKWNNVPKQKH